MRDHILESLANDGILLEPAAADLVMSRPDPLRFVRMALASMQERPMVLTVDELGPQMARDLAEELEDEGLPVSEEVAALLLNLPRPRRFVHAAIAERVRRGLGIPPIITQDDLIVNTEAGGRDP